MKNNNQKKIQGLLAVTVFSLLLNILMIYHAKHVKNKNPLIDVDKISILKENAQLQRDIIFYQAELDLVSKECSNKD